MICYRDMTFCPFHKTCLLSGTCDRALTDEVMDAATKWWGDEDAPIAVFMEKPSCYDDKGVGT